MKIKFLIAVILLCLASLAGFSQVQIAKADTVRSFSNDTLKSVIAIPVTFSFYNGNDTQKQSVSIDTPSGTYIFEVDSCLGITHSDDNAFAAMTYAGKYTINARVVSGFFARVYSARGLIEIFERLDTQIYIFNIYNEEESGSNL